MAKAIADSLLPRHAMYYAALGEAFHGKEAERIGLINFSVPAEQVRDKVTELAVKLMAKSPRALRATKQAVRNVKGMDVVQAYDYLGEKSTAISVGDKDDSYKTGLRQFLDEKSYKPAHAPFKRGTMLKS